MSKRENLIESSLLVSILAAAVISFGAMMSSAHSADVVCAKLKSTNKTGYPVSKDAVKLAQHMNVKKCSESFLVAAKALGQDVKFVLANDDLRTQLAKQKLENMKSRVVGFEF